MAPQPNPLSETFKPRELEVLRLIAAGRTNQEIAAHLMIEVTTVRWHNLYNLGNALCRLNEAARATPFACRDWLPAGAARSR